MILPGNHRCQFERRSRERGAALLFAIGILAMLMMLGLGFVTNAMIANRIASNNSRRSQTRALARAAVAHAMTQIMLYADQANDPNAIANDADRTLYNFDFIRSTGDSVSYNQGSSPASGVLNDQLTGSGTKLACVYDNDYDVSGKEYRFGADDASWVVFYDDAGLAAGDRKIIGRAAWHVLPRHVRADGTPEIDDGSTLSLFKMLAGAVGAAGGTAPSETSEYVLLNERGKVAWENRWGRGVEEMYLDLPGSLFENWITNGDNSAEAPPYSYDMLFSAYQDYFGSSASTRANRKAWIRKWFGEGDNRLAKEAYASGSGSSVIYRHRFNLGDRNNIVSGSADLDWYDRFSSGVLQNLGSGVGNVLDDLAAPSQVYRERDVSDDGNYRSGLPFLKRIGNDPWSFATIELFRKQIAANLNDYCDPDDIPTSDIQSADWSVTDSTKFPHYTGNEKTSYINEFAWVFDIPLKFAKPGSGKFSGFTVNPTLDTANVAAAMFAELVNIYNADPAGAYSLDAQLKNFNLSLALTLTYNISLSYSYTDSDSNMHSGLTANATKSFNHTLTLEKAAAETPLAFSAFTGTAYRLQGVAPTVALVSGSDLAAPDLATPCLAEVTAAIPEGGTLSSWSVSDVSLAVRAVPTVSSFEMSPLLLKCGGSPVDFANFDQTAMGGAFTVDTSTAGDTKFLKVDALTGSSDPLLKLRFVLAGFEATDPRQNLNPKTSGNSDWYLKPMLIAAKVGGPDAEHASAGNLPDQLSSNTVAPTMTYDGTQDAAAQCFTLGGVNTCGSPAAANTITDGTPTPDTAHATSDTETATDPAWTADAAGSRISTAVIRNAPMKSLWELGAIHRARPWQTLNLTGASNFVASGSAGGNITAADMVPSNFATWTQSTGTDYAKGDGGILDMVKLSDACRAWGKLDFTLLTAAKISDDESAFPGMEAFDKALVKSLFWNIRQGQSLQDFLTASAAAGGGDASATGTKLNASTSPAVSNDVVNSFIDASNGAGMVPSAMLRSELLNTNYGESGATCGLAGATDDAAQEEIIGKTIGLLSANGRTIPNVFRILIVAQSIDDIGGVGTDIPVVKRDSGGNDHTVNCRQGVFNYCSATDQSGNSYNLYFDRITGEIKLLATVERDPDTGSLKIRQLEYLD